MSEALHVPESADPNIGMVLQDRYRIIRKVGEGGMGAVYEAEHVLIKRRVAIKCLHAQFATHPEIVARFHREALAVTSIGHENIVEVTDMGRFPDQSVYMVLEFLQGRDWADDLERGGAQAVGKTVRIMEQVCDALQAAHDKDIVHRDLKPENIFLIERAGNPDFVKVVDFGISKFKDTDTVQSMTRTGTAMGTPFYMSPEQAQGRKDIDHRSDIYSLGVILFQALTGQYPFDDEAYPMLVLKICTEPAPNAALFRRDLPAGLAHIVDKCLQKNPADRYQDCASLKRALSAFREVTDAPQLDENAPKTASFTASAMQARAGGQTDLSFGESQLRLAHAATVTPVGVPVTSVATAAPGAMDDPAPALPTRGNALPIVAGAALLVAVAVGAAVALSSGGHDPEVAPSAQAPGSHEAHTTDPGGGDTTPVQAAAPVPPTEEPPGTTSTPAAAVTVQITTEPVNAEVYLDGMRIPNPFDGELPQTTDPRRLEVRAEGYTTIAQDLVLQFPQRVRLTLLRGTGIDDRSTAATRRSSGSRPASSPPTSTMAAAELPAPPMAVASEMVATPAPTPAPTPPTEPAADTNMALKQIRF
ncbi:MAG: protein kinase [Polyangiales bacterium]|nr:protein kinase [Myxococcales bacterium]MCB9658137.1 protein kinase [Sandaracinaceae bacterium]